MQFTREELLDIHCVLLNERRCCMAGTEDYEIFSALCSKTRRMLEELDNPPVAQ